MDKISKILLVLVMTTASILLLGLPALALYLYVDDDDPICGGKVPCFETLQAAFDAAEDGDTIWVANGAYKGNGNKDFNLTKALTFRSENGPDNCVIDLEGVGKAFLINGVHSKDSVIVGFTIQNGNVDGAIRWGYSSASITIRNCIFLNNKDSALGGLWSDSHLEISDCTFRGNERAITISTCNNILISGCLFENNFIDYGHSAAIKANIIEELTIINSDFIGNTAKYGGGAIYLNTIGKLKFLNCQIIGNTSYASGGGIYSSGSGISTEFTNCIIAGNKSIGNGGGIYLGGRDYYPKFINCTIYSNKTVEGEGGAISLKTPNVMLEINNSIIWDNGYPEIGFRTVYPNDPPVEPYPLISYSDFNCPENYFICDENTIYEDPDFKADGYWDDNGTPLDPSDDLWVDGDYHLQVESPCIDSGDNNTADLSEIDIDGKPRIVDGNGDGSAVVDMGVYEYGDICEGDFYSDLDVDGADIATYANDPGSFDLAIIANDYGRANCPVYELMP